jgi:hypothetical protein
MVIGGTSALALSNQQDGKSAGLIQPQIADPSLYKSVALKRARMNLFCFCFWISIPPLVHWECENPEGISKRRGKGGKPAFWLSTLSTPRHFQRAHLLQ